MTELRRRPWAAIPDSLNVVINLQQVLIWPHGADTSEIDAFIEAGFVISNVTVLFHFIRDAVMANFAGTPSPSLLALG